jgi:hypothetical protein
MRPPKERRDPRKKPVHDEKGKQQDSNRTREPQEKRQPGGFAANCRFETAHMSESGAIYEAEQHL